MKRRDFLKLLTFCFVAVNAKSVIAETKQSKIEEVNQPITKPPNIFSWLRKKV
jgi:hypothetical protein